MKRTRTTQHFVISVLGMGMLLFSCSKEAGPSAPSVLKFAVHQATYSEADGQGISLGKALINADLVLSDKQSQEVSGIQFTWSSAKATYYNGDFAVGTPDSFLPGHTTAKFNMMIIDDRQLDLDDTITFTLTGVTGNALLSSTPSDNTFRLIITNDDVLPSNSMQVDLVWSAGPAGNIDEANLDLYIQYNVVYDSVNHLITNTGVTQNMSNTTSGFETTFIIPNDPDQVYWIAVPYVSGTIPVDFTIAINGFGNDGAVFKGTEGPGDAGTARFFGPFVKFGKTFVSGRYAQIKKSGNVSAVEVNHFPRPN